MGLGAPKEVGSDETWSRPTLMIARPTVLTMTARMRCRVCVSNTYTSLSFSVQAAREKETIERLASKTHKDKVNEFNEKLANLTEHHDIPKVGPG